MHSDGNKPYKLSTVLNHYCDFQFKITLATASFIGETLYFDANLFASNSLLLRADDNTYDYSYSVKFFHLKLGSILALYIHNMSL